MSLRDAREQQCLGWIRAGQENQKSPFVIVHCLTVVEQSGGRDLCPFDDDYPVARERWLSMHHCWSWKRNGIAREYILPGYAKEARFV